MSDQKLKVNDDKTEFLAIGTKSKISRVSPYLTPISFSGYDTPFSQSMENLGFYLEETLPLDAHINS